MSTPQQLLYTQAVSQCPDIVAIVPWTHVFVTFTFTFVLFIALQRIFAGVGILPFIITFLTLGWYIVTIIIATYKDYTFWDKHPNYETFARCSLNKEYNEHLALKFTVLNVLSQKLVACLLSWNVGRVPIKVFRCFILLVKLFMVPVLVARGVAALGATVGMGWAHCYFFIVGALSTANSTKIQWNPGMLWMGAAEAMVCGSEEEQDSAAAIMTAAEGAMIEAGEEVPSGSSPTSTTVATTTTVTVEGEEKPADEQQQQANNEPAAASPTADDKHAKLRFFAEHFDKSSLLPKLIFVTLYSISVYAAVISWDWRYDQNGITYAQSFSTFDVYRPTMKALYDGAGKLTNEQLAYIACLWS